MTAAQRIFDRPWSLAVGIASKALGLPMVLFALFGSGRNARTQEIGMAIAIIGVVLVVIGAICLVRARPLRLDLKQRALVRGTHTVHDLSQAQMVVLWHGSIDDSSGCVLVVDGREADGRELHEQLLHKQPSAAATVSAATIAPIPHVLRIGIMQRFPKARRLADEFASGLDLPLVQLSGQAFVAVD